MNRTEHLLWVLAEECAEVAQRASKAARFGLNEVQPGQPHTNAERIVYEYADLVATMELLGDAAGLTVDDLEALKSAKKAKIEKYLVYSRQCGTLRAEALIT